MARPEVLADFKRVRLLGWSGKHLLVLRITESDPDPTWQPTFAVMHNTPGPVKEAAIGRRTPGSTATS
jgi:hypothetical protein